MEQGVERRRRLKRWEEGQEEEQEEEEEAEAEAEQYTSHHDMFKPQISSIFSHPLTNTPRCHLLPAPILT